MGRQVRGPDFCSNLAPALLHSQDVMASVLPPGAQEKPWDLPGDRCVLTWAGTQGGEHTG